MEERSFRFFLIKLQRSLFSIFLLSSHHRPQIYAGTSTNDVEHTSIASVVHFPPSRDIDASRKMHRANRCGLTGKNRTIRMRPRFCFRVSPVALSRLVKIYWPLGHCVLCVLFTPFYLFIAQILARISSSMIKVFAVKCFVTLSEFFYLSFRIKVHHKVDKFCRHIYDTVIFKICFFQDESVLLP